MAATRLEPPTEDTLVAVLAALALEWNLFLSFVDAGKTEMSAPVSTKKEQPDSLSNTDKAPTLESMDEIVGEAPGVNPSRRSRFPPEADG